MMSKNYYTVLGVAKSATPEEIKKSYRKLAMQYHPDRNQGDKKAEQKFKEISEAYDILSDPQKKATYDRYGAQAFEGGGAQSNEGFAGFDAFSGFADILDEMFGGSRSRPSDNFQQSGSDIRFNLEVSLEDAFKGITSRIRYPTGVICDICKGHGSDPSTPPIQCPTCNGYGKSRYQQGFFTIERTCHACQGAGRIVQKPCRPCQGSGCVRKEKNLEVKIPPGVEDGTRIRVPKEGEAGLRGGPSGDLYVFISIQEHRLFKRNGPDLTCLVPIPMTTAILGGEIEVPVIDGEKVKVKIPQGTQSHQTFRQRSKGMSILKSHARGDMIIEVVVETPVNLSKKQKDLLKQFAGDSESNSPKTDGFFARVKEWFDGKKP